MVLEGVVLGEDIIKNTVGVDLVVVVVLEGVGVVVIIKNMAMVREKINLALSAFQNAF